MDASTTLRLDNTPFAQAIDQAETKAKTFSSRVRGLLGGGGRSPWQDFVSPLGSATSKIQAFENRVGRLFRRDPNRRAEVALSEFAANLATGNVAGAVTGLTTRISAFGLAAGIAVGGAVALFTKFKGEVDATTAAEKALGRELATLGGIRGPEEAAKKMAALGTATQDLITKSSSAGSKVSNFIDKFINPLVGTSSRNKGAAQQAEITSGLRAQGKLLSDRANAEEDVIAFRNKSLNVSERQGELDKIARDAAEKRSAIDEEAINFKLDLFKAGKNINQVERDRLIGESLAAAAKRKAAVTSDELLSTDQVNQQFDIKQRQVAVEQTLANLAASHASADSQRMAAAKTELSLIEEQLANSKQLTAEERAQLQVAQTRAQSKVSNQAAERFFNSGSWEAQEVFAAQQRERLKVIPKGFEPQYPGQMPSLDISGNLIPSSAYKTSPEAYGQTGGPKQPGSAAGKPMTKEEFKSIMQEFWGD